MRAGAGWLIRSSTASSVTPPPRSFGPRRSNPVNDFAISRAISREFGVWAPLPGLATHVHLDLAPDVRSPAFPFDAVYNETRAGARRLAALLAV